jgi:uncharacterized metal-binding protein YceD (DUF177 family)
MSKNNDFIIQYSGLSLGTHPYELEVGKAFFEALDYHEFEDCRIKVGLDLEKSASMLVLFFKIGGSVKANCDRCLEEMFIKLDGDFKQLVKISDYAEHDENDEIFIVPSAEYEIDITKFVFDFILLSMPPKAVHEVGECDEDALEKLSSYWVKISYDPDDEFDFDDEYEDEEDLDDDDYEDTEEEEDNNKAIDPRWKALMDLKNKEN